MKLFVKIALSRRLLLLLAIVTTTYGWISTPASALNEIFDTYSTTQALSMGNAMTADASGYLANYYNPAGLARGQKRRWEVILLDAEALASVAAVSRVAAARGIGITQLMAPMAANAGQYTYFNLSSVPAVTTRDFGISFLADYQYAGLSDGTNIDINTHVDLGPTVGISTNLFGNLLKVGISGKAFLREELVGDFAISSLSTSAEVAAASSEGIGLGADAGMIFTLPYKYLPTIGVVWKNMFNTSFIPINILNKSATGAPTTINQSINTGFSVHPILARHLQATLAFEIQHWELTQLPFQKKVHFGLQLQSDKSFYIWIGANQLLLTGGVALRLPGGDLEIGTYAVDVGSGTQIDSDRRFSFRYTISF